MDTTAKVCPKCGNWKRVKSDDKGPFYCADCGWMRGRSPLQRAVPKIGRNAPCPCGSGKKFKRCCLIGNRRRVCGF